MAEIQNNNQEILHGCGQIYKITNKLNNKIYIGQTVNYSKSNRLKR